MGGLTARPCPRAARNRPLTRHAGRRPRAQAACMLHVSYPVTDSRQRSGRASLSKAGGNPVLIFANLLRSIIAVYCGHRRSRWSWPAASGSRSANCPTSNAIGRGWRGRARRACGHGCPPAPGAAYWGLKPGRTAMPHRSGRVSRAVLAPNLSSAQTVLAVESPFSS